MTWNAPSDVGSSPITAYVLQRRSSGDVTRQPLGSVPALPCSVTVRNLSGVFQQFRVAARNSVGLGPWSATSNAVIPYAPPGAPGQPRATAKPGKVVALTWPAAAAHGAAVTYTVQTASATGAWSNCATTTRLSWSGAFTTAKVGQVRRFRIVPTTGPAGARPRPRSAPPSADPCCPRGPQPRAKPHNAVTVALYGRGLCRSARFAVPQAAGVRGGRGSCRCWRR